jgi:hypothetical protein
MFKKFIVLIFSLFFPFLNIASANYSQSAIWNTKLNDEQIISLLKTNAPKQIIPMREYLHSNLYQDEFEGEVYLVILENNIKAAFKIVPEDDLGDAIAEVAAYKASKLLDLGIVPPTIMRKINGKYGSLQLFIKPSVDALSRAQYEKAINMADRTNLANLKLFYYIFGQWDSGPNNLIIQYVNKKPFLIAIDNAGIRNHQYCIYGQRPFVKFYEFKKPFYNQIKTINSKSFPYEKSKTVMPKEEKLKNIFGNAIPEEYIERLCRYKRPIKYVIWQNTLWIQVNREDDLLNPIFTDYYPSKTINKLKTLDKTMLQEIFSHATNTGFLNDSYFQAILERRDQIIKAYNQKYK